MPDSLLMFMPIIVQLCAAVAMFFAWGRVRFPRRASVVVSAVGLVAAVALFVRVWQGGTFAVQAGGWAAPFGISLVADVLAATMVLLTAIAALAVSIFSVGTVIPQRVKFGYFPILHILFMGLNGAFLTGDVFNLYVWFEIIIISSFVLLTIGGERPQLEGAVKYFTLNMLASIIFLTAIAVVYGITGTLNLAQLAEVMPLVKNTHLVDVTAVLFIAGFGTKAALFPLYFWLPASYHTPPDAVSAVFAGLLTKLGVYAIIRVFSLLYAHNALPFEILTIAAGCTMLAGGAAALVQNNIRKAFSYLIICHIGYMVAGIGIASVAAYTGVVFYLVHDVVVKTNLFMAAALLYRLSGTSGLRQMGGVYDRYPMLALLLAVPLFSLVGIPPLSGFWPKLALISAGWADARPVITGLILVASFLTLVVIARVWAQAFWNERPKGVVPKPGFVHWDALTGAQRRLYLIPIGLLAVVSLYIGFGAGHIERLSTRAATELSNPQLYIEAVFGDRGKGE